MGLLDWFGNQQPGVLGGLLGGQFNADAGTDADIRKALMAAGFGMLQQRGARGIGQGGLQGLQTFGLAQEGRRRNEFQDFTIGEAKRRADKEAKDLALLEQFRARIPPPQVQQAQAVQAGLAGGGGPTVANAATMTRAQNDQNAQLMYEALMAGQLSPAEYLSASQKATQAPKFGHAPAGSAIFNEATGATVGTVPKEEPDRTPEAVKLLRIIYGENSPEYVSALKRLGVKTTSHPEPASISFGPPIPVVDENGVPRLIQPSKGGGKPAVIPGFQPPPQKMGEKQVNQIAGIDALGSAVDEYVSAMSGWKKLDALNPNKRAAIGTAYNNMMLQAKEAYNLGVLNGPDYSILQSVVKDPTSWSAAITSNEALIQQANELKRIMGGVRDAVTNAKKPKPPAAAASAAADKTVNLNRLTPAQKAEYEALQKELGVK